MRILVALLVLCAALRADAGDLPVHQRIDQLVAAPTKGFAKLAAKPCDDTTFLRRATLDLTGRLPTADEVVKFNAIKDSTKRQKLVDRLLTSAEYARHMQHVYDAVLMQRITSNNVPRPLWQEFLRKSFADNRSWDSITREILSADGVSAKKRGQARFYLDRDAKVDPLTRQIGRLFLGADLECAQCHDHPEVGDYKQVNYYGIAAFLVRSYVFKNKKRQMLAEKAVGEVSFRSVFERNVKGSKTTLPVLFGGKTFKEPKLAKAKQYIVKPAKNVRPVPRYSRRAKLADAVIHAGGNRFARTFVNRLWARLIGRGIIEPVDLDHKDNPGSHPKLLAYLADEFRKHKYDIRWLSKQIVMSQTYQRASNSQPPKEGGETFATGKLKPLLPEQLAWALLDATGRVAQERKRLGKGAKEALIYKALRPTADKIVTAMAHRPGKIPRGFNSQVEHSLFLLNSPIMGELIATKEGNLASDLGKLKDTRKLVESLYLRTLSRVPSAEEIQIVTNFIGKAKDKKKTRQSQIEELIWVLITSPEFRFNH